MTISGVSVDSLWVPADTAEVCGFSSEEEDKRRRADDCCRLLPSSSVVVVVIVVSPAWREDKGLLLASLLRRLQDIPYCC